MTSRQLRIILALEISAIAMAFGVSAQAATTRTFVSTIGNDANTSLDCSPTAPCRTFAAALSVTNAGGEIVVLTSGGYGPATISQPVVITAIGVDASISATTFAANGLTINTPGNVTLIGLNLHGEANGNDGIHVQQIAILRLYNILVENFTHAGVDFEVSGKLAIYGSRINDNSADGLIVNNASANASVHETSFDNSSFGVIVFAGRATVSDSSAEFDGIAFSARGGTLTLFNDRATSNDVGLDSFFGGTLYFANCVVADNTTAYETESGSMLAGTSPGTSLIVPGQSTTGTLSTAITLQ